jgi:GMP synthase-like glutamine amidotransferase
MAPVVSASQGKKSMSPRPLRLCIIDMNNAHVNQAMRCLRGIAQGFFDHVARKNPDLPCELVEVSPRDTSNPVPRDCDFYVSSGGPGSPFDGDGQPWFADYGRFSEGVLESAARGGADQRALFAICYSFEMVVRHLGLAQIGPRAERKFGVMPVYTTPEGQRHPLLAPFGDRLFAFEHRNWEAIDLDEARLRELGGQREPGRRLQGPSDPGARRGPGHRGGAVPPRGRPAWRDELGGSPRAGRRLQGRLR